MQMTVLFIHGTCILILYTCNDVQWLVCIILFVRLFLWRNLIMGEYFFFFLLTLFKLGCLCWSVWDLAFHVETLLLIRLSKSIYKFGYRFIGQHISYRLSNIKNYRCRPKWSYRCIPNFYIQKLLFYWTFYYRSTDISVYRYFSRYLSILPLSDISIGKKKDFFFICHIHNYTEYNQQWNVFFVFDPSKYTHTWSSGHTHTHTWSSVHSGEAPARPPHVTFIQDSLVWNTLNYINIYYRTIISPINISFEIHYLLSLQAIAVWV